MAAITVGYWDVRGLAESIRYLLHYKNVPFEDKRYTLDKRTSWFEEKFTLGLDFPNLPYYIEGEDIKLTQSVAILRYLAEKHGLEGRTEEERRRVLLAEQQMFDFRAGLSRLSYGGNFEQKKPDYVKGLPAQLKLIADFLGDRRFLAGDGLTYVDFMAYEAIDFHRFLVPGLLDAFPTLEDYQKRIRNLPELLSYFSSPQYRRWPIFSPLAAFGGKGPEPQQ